MKSLEKVLLTFWWIRGKNLSLQTWRKGKRSV